MRINNNMSAVLTNNQLLGTEDSLANVMEKLSSGLSINHASDNPSGIAIAGNMKAQIEGLEQASTNSEDGISVLQTAEGALGEVTDMVQRMRELSVQAANGTNSTSERESIQMEIDSLLEEIDRISSTTQFNSINLLDGSLDCRTYASHCSRIQTSNSVAAGTYRLTITAAAMKAEVKSTAVSAKILTQFSENTITKTKTTVTGNVPDATDNFYSFIDSQTWQVKTEQEIYNQQGKFERIDTNVETGSGLSISGTISINGYSTTIGQGSSGEEVYEALRIACEYGSATISDPSELLSISSLKYGKDAYLDIEFSSEEFAKALGFSDSVLDPDNDGKFDTAIKYTGADAKVRLEKKYEVDADGKPVVDATTGKYTETGSDFGMQATVSYDGNKITVSDTNGFELSFKADAGYTGDITFNVTDIGSMTLQVGANEGQNMDVRIRSTNIEYMYIDEIDVTKMDGPEDAIRRLDDALSYVTSIRSQLGAYENRLEHTTKSLDETSENMTSAISRIEDADMATTMVEYTKLNVLEQAATSALAQANELPQLALQLLQ